MACIFLDRDGVINISEVRNGKPYAPKTFSDFKLHKNIEKSLYVIKSKGFYISIFTNQPDVNIYSNMKKEIEKMHQYLMDNFPIDNIEVCYHNDKYNCNCRKPKIGMLINAAKKLKVNLNNSIVVGDRWSDIEAGQNAGCKCYFINYQYKEKKPQQPYTEVLSLEHFSQILKKKQF